MKSLALVLGVLLTVGGLFGVGIYVVGVIDIIIEQPPDRSWLFWGLGIAGMGAMLLSAGIALLFVWRSVNGKRAEKMGDPA